MLFSEIIEKQNPFQISIISDNDMTLHLTNAVLDVNSVQAELYIRVFEKDVLLARLKPEILQCSLNVVINLQKSPILIAKKGNVHVCGNIVEKAPQENQVKKIVSEPVINTNKKINQLSKEHLKEVTTSKEKVEKNESQTSKLEINNKIGPSAQSNIRKSSRLSSRRSTTPAQTQEKLESTLKQNKDSKKEQKSEKKKEKSQSLLQNGRYSLKALLQNIDDDSEQDQDEEFSNSGEDEDSDDDSDFDNDEGEEDEQTISKPKKSTHKQSSKSIKRSKHEDEIQQKQIKEKKPEEKSEKQQKEPSISSVLKSHFQPQIEVTEQEDSDDRKQIKPQEYQQKWPETAESPIQKEANERQQKISQLASKIKCPTKRPTI